MFDKILLPIDGSEASDRAAHIAADLASRCGAEIIVLHVCEREYVYGVDISPEQLEDANELVERHVRRMKDAGQSARGEVVSAAYGRTARGILDLAEDERGRPHRDGDARAFSVEPADGRKRRPQGSPLGAGTGPCGPVTPRAAQA